MRIGERVKRAPRAATGNTRLTDFDELRDAVLSHARAVGRVSTITVKEVSGDQTLAVFGE